MARFTRWATPSSQPELARTLERIAKTRLGKDFYEGETARCWRDAMAKNGGLITLDDLKNYEAVERAPLTGKYRDYGVITAPPPSSGGIGILQMMGMLEGSGYEKIGSGIGRHHSLHGGGDAPLLTRTAASIWAIRISSRFR